MLRTIDAFYGMIIGRICTHAHTAITSTRHPNFTKFGQPLRMDDIIDSIKQSEFEDKKYGVRTSALTALVTSNWSGYPNPYDIRKIYECLSNFNILGISNQMTQPLDEEGIILLAPLLAHCVSRGLSTSYLTNRDRSDQLKELEKYLHTPNGLREDDRNMNILTMAGYSEERSHKMNHATYDEFMRDILIHGGNGALAGFIKGWYRGQQYGTYEAEEFPVKWIAAVEKSRFHVPGIHNFASANFKGSCWDN